MKQIAGTIMAIGGILIVPPLWTEIADGGFWPRIIFAAAIASIVTGLVLSLKKTRRSTGGAR